MTSLACWCPAFALTDTAQVAQVRQRAAQLATALGLGWVEAQTLGNLSPPSTWRPSVERVAELQALWQHRVLLAARGGHGCVHLLSDLPKSSVAPLLIGYSDLTVLHAAWWNRTWGESLYGYMPAAGSGERALATTVALARGEAQKFDSASDPTVLVANPGEATGRLFAGCLSVLAGLCGSSEQPNLREAILAIEDIDERVYRVDRNLEQCWRSGLLKGVTGLVFGRFPATEPTNYGGPDLVALATHWGQRLGVPTVVGLPFGHEPDPLTLACGRLSTLTATATGWSLTQATVPSLLMPGRRS